MGRTARTWAELMRRLGYQRYGVHGGDVGAGVSGMVARLDGEHVIGLHVVTDPLTAAATATFLPPIARRLDHNDPVGKPVLAPIGAFQEGGPGRGPPASPCWTARQPGRSTRWGPGGGCSPGRRPPPPGDGGPASRTSRPTSCRRWPTSVRWSGCT